MAMAMAMSISAWRGATHTGGRPRSSVGVCRSCMPGRVCVGSVLVYSWCMCVRWSERKEGILLLVNCSLHHCSRATSGGTSNGFSSSVRTATPLPRASNAGCKATPAAGGERARLAEGQKWRTRAAVRVQGLFWMGCGARSSFLRAGRA